MEVTEELLDRIDRLAELETGGPEREKARGDMEEMIRYVNRIEEVDTTGVVPLVQPVEDVEQPFREDAEETPDSPEGWLANAPALRDGMVVTPQTIIHE